MRRQLVECDRCEERIEDAERTAGRAYVATLAGDDVLGTSEVPADLCARCIAALRRFLADPSIADA